MDILIDNKDLKTYFGITTLDYHGVFSFASEREDNREWYDKSGIDKNIDNIRYDPKEFIFKCITKADNDAEAYNVVKTLIDYMFSVGNFVLSLRDSVQGIRECYLCERSNTIVGEINLRQQNSLYYFKLGMKDVNPNALKYKTDVVFNQAVINYTKGQWANIYWGDGRRDEISNSDVYTKTGYAADVPVDIIVDIDENAETIATISADFTVDVVSGVKPQDVIFTDISIGDISIWAWDFGDGFTSSDESPTHTYEESGTYTVTLEIFNSVNGASSETKIDYIVIVDSSFSIDGTDLFLINGSGDKLLIN